MYVLSMKDCCNPLVMSAVGQERETCVTHAGPLSVLVHTLVLHIEKPRSRQRNAHVQFLFSSSPGLASGYLL